MAEPTHKIVSAAWESLFDVPYDPTSFSCIMFGYGWNAALTTLMEHVEKKKEESK